MLIKKVRENVFDVFVGIGWNHWSRMSKGTGGKWYMIAGQRLTTQQFFKFKSLV